jgi:hypothetical protein
MLYVCDLKQRITTAAASADEEMSQCVWNALIVPFSQAITSNSHTNLLNIYIYIYYLQSVYIYIYFICKCFAFPLKVRTEINPFLSVGTAIML